MENLNYILPEIIIAIGIMFLLILGVFKKESENLVQNTSLIILIIAAVVTFNETLSNDPMLIFNESVIIDSLSSFMKIITLLAASLVIVISSAYLKIFKLFKIESFV